MVILSRTRSPGHKTVQNITISDFAADGKPVPPYVKEVTPGSAADRAGLKVGDVLERVNKRSVIGLSRPEVLIMVGTGLNI